MGRSLEGSTVTEGHQTLGRGCEPEAVCITEAALSELWSSFYFIISLYTGNSNVERFICIYSGHFGLSVMVFLSLILQY